MAALSACPPLRSKKAPRLGMVEYLKPGIATFVGTGMPERKRVAGSDSRAGLCRELQFPHSILVSVA